MSRSTKKHPVCKGIIGSQKKGKKFCHRLFRARESMAMRTEDERKLPFFQREIIDQWDLFDGREFFGNCTDKKHYAYMMRK